MKYMGHKGKLLPLLGEILKAEAVNASKIADPFCGSGAVSWYMAQETDKGVLSGDLQSFAVTRAAAVVERTRAIDSNRITKRWFESARAVVDNIVSQFPNAAKSIHPEISIPEIQSIVIRSRTFCDEVLPPLLSRMSGDFPMTHAYGGHYFSPLQAIEIDALRQTLPKSAETRKACLAALVEAASRCAAAPGHTAQPFQPTKTAAKFIAEAWNRNVWLQVSQALETIASTHATVKGATCLGDYHKCISQLEPGDLVFADPPYSDVHYSRFYHVLETLTRGKQVPVTGVGRYPPISQRPSSNFSQKGQAFAAAQRLIEICMRKEVNLVLTFPSNKASNGLSTRDFVAMGRGKFRSIETEQVNSTFSTLGGKSSNRGGRIECSESIVCFRV
ncbi:MULTISPECIES: DNA adenine methylase [unclassified Burkholderia]|uniref:DNA adenine methylase n=1 Tax=unclassified Burkholderia TaxID=2613784 RepID=UPI0021AB88EB|nr:MULTISPECIES: DNA adenine methylase [unclassified Burkholderia]